MDVPEMGWVTGGVVCEAQVLRFAEDDNMGGIAVPVRRRAVCIGFPHDGAGGFVPTLSQTKRKDGAPGFSS